MKLYGSLTSPYVRKVRIVLREKDIPCEFIVQGPSDPGSRVPALNPLGKVPVLERDDGEVLFDSPLICEYLDSLKGEPLVPASGEPRWQVLRWQALSQGILDAVVLRMLELRRFPDKQLPEAVSKQEVKVAQALAYADRGLPAGQYLVGDRFSLADIAMATAFDYMDFRYAHDWRKRHPRLGEWHAAINRRPGFRETLPPEMRKQ
ncbi:MAG TPA: glutathione S-transferase N-terminal domain-containing protein [Acidiferrobacterales bacterium]